ncbi:protein kinase [Capnocytophaga sp.]|uniref:protein kinase domain-containing protein n=1 Tax=Capnocytophaga sp. TaxID=44737 RepID=UPI0026DBD405|nr:protein kinase [Capnocytophaga sp.]MDO5105880.1 protein kinase [Capnocytophaga sp.]
MATSMQNIVTSVKNLKTFLKVPDLQGAVAVKKNNGQPFCYTGGFNMVFQLEHQGQKWAFRVWHVPFGADKERFQKIANYLKTKNLPYFATFIYDANGLLVNGKLQDTIRMEWLEGTLLKDFLRENLYNKEALFAFAEKFKQMTQVLHKNQISHGDLQHGNILIDSDNSIKLVDYDSVCIPEIEGEEEIVSGLKGYQHPSRFQTKKTSLTADYFSEMVIYLSVLALIENPDLWEKYQLEDSEYLLFSESDFVNFKQSEVYKDLQQLSPMVRNLAFVFDVYTRNANYLTIHPMEDYRFLNLNAKVKHEILTFMPDIPHPLMIQFATSRTKILEGDTVELSWKVKNASKVYLSDSFEDLSKLADNQSDSLSTVATRGVVQKSPTESTVYVLYCEPLQSIDSQGVQPFQIVDVEVFPRPEIRNFGSSEAHIRQGESVFLNWHIENAKKVYIWSGGVCNTVKSQDKIEIQLSRTTKYKLEVLALDGETTIEKEIEISVHNKVQIIDFELVYGDVAKEEPAVKLRWNVLNASEIILKSNKAPDQDVSALKELVITPAKKAKYWIEARNQCFETKSEKLIVESHTSIASKKWFVF